MVYGISRGYLTSNLNKSRLTKSNSGAQNMKIILKLPYENFLVMTYVIIYIGQL